MQLITIPPLRVTRLLTKEANTVPFPSLWRSAGKKEAGLGSTIFNRVAKPLGQRLITTMRPVATQAGQKTKTWAGNAYRTVADPDMTGLRWNGNAAKKYRTLTSKYKPIPLDGKFAPEDVDFKNLVNEFRGDLGKRGFAKSLIDWNAAKKGNGAFSIPFDFRRGSDANSALVGLTTQSPATAAHEFGHLRAHTEQWGRYLPKSVKSFWRNKVSPHIPKQVKNLNPWRDPTEAAPLYYKTRNTSNWLNNQKWLNNERVKSFLSPSYIRRGLGKKTLFAPKGESASLADAQQYIQAPWSNQQWLNNISGRVFNAPVQAGLNAASTALTGIPLGSIPSMALNVAANGPTLYHELNASARGLIGLARKKGLNYAWKQSPQLRHAFNTYSAKAVPGLMRNATGLAGGYGGYQGYQALNNAYRSPQQSR